MSGRGVGMGSVHAACQALNSQIEVVSQEGKGSTFAHIDRGKFGLKTL